MASVTKVVVFDEHIYRTAGMANKWMTVMTTRFGEHAKRHAPIRSGNLRARIRTNTQQVGIKQIEGTITSGARYSTFVLGGTHGPIHANEGKLRLRPGAPTHGKYAGQVFGRTAANWVHGQDANNFLAKAWRTTAHTHSCLRGKGFPLQF